MSLKLFHLLIGCTPPGRFIEQHDVFFGIAEQVRDLVPYINAFWPDANGKMHLDAWREVNYVGENKLEILPKQNRTSAEKLYFINLGGYKPKQFTEFHFQELIVAKNMAQAIAKAKALPFYADFNLTPHGHSHIDDKYLLDVDDVHEVQHILPMHQAEKYSIGISPHSSLMEDELHIGYFKLSSL